MPDYEFRTLESLCWEDGIPDRLTIAVNTSTGNSEAYVTFTSNYTWLTPQIVREEIIPFLEKCCKTADLHNILKELKEGGDAI